ncbi:MAG: hypothetical protein JJT95_15720 [Pararhodobacter sp.]|nr:hypothetical protein [Pararhodobacter sp.]
MTLIAALALVLAMLGHGFARAQPPQVALQAVVICAAEGGEAVIHVDERGVPVSPDEPCAQLCPDCLAVSAFSLAGPDSALLRVDKAPQQATPPVLEFLSRRDCSWAAARGPPIEV